MRYNTLLYIPYQRRLKNHTKPTTNQQLTLHPGITLNRLFLHLRVEREILFGLFLQPQN